MRVTHNLLHVIRVVVVQRNISMNISFILFMIHDAWQDLHPKEFPIPISPRQLHHHSVLFSIGGLSPSIPFDMQPTFSYSQSSILSD